MIPVTQEITIKLPVSLYVKQQNERFQLLLNDQVFNFYENEAIGLRVSKNYLIVGLK